MDENILMLKQVVSANLAFRMMALVKESVMAKKIAWQSLKVLQLDGQSQMTSGQRYLLYSFWRISLLQPPYYGDECYLSYPSPTCEAPLKQ